MYRNQPTRPPEPRSRVTDRSVPHMTIEIDNGVTSRIALPCYYAYRKDGMPLPHHEIPPIMQDHIGWPRPDARDRSFQPLHVEGLVIEPIHLQDEGYEQAIVTLKDAPSGLSATAELDDSIIRVTVTAMCDEADSEAVEVPFSLYVSGTLTDGDTQFQARDIVTSGTIKVLPAVHS